MSLTAFEYKSKGNEYYAKKDCRLAIESYSEAIKLVENNVNDENVPLYVLYLNRSAAYIQEKNYYSAYEDAKKSLKLKKDENLKGFYRAALSCYHLGFLDKCQLFINEATKDQQGNLIDYLDLKLLIEKKLNSMKKWRKPVATAKQSLKNLEKIIQNGVLIFEIVPILYQIRYLLRSYFENKKEKKLMNINTGDLGLRLHQLALQFNLTINVDKLIELDPLFEDLILNEMPDVGSLRLKAHKQKGLPREERDYDLEEKAQQDLTAYEFSFFTNNVLASLVVNSKDENLSLRALKQLHRLTTNDLYRNSLGDALSDAMNNSIYSQSKNSILCEKLVSNGGIEIFFYDYIEAACQQSAARMIKNITPDQWKKQSIATIQLVIKQISRKIKDQDIELVEPKKATKFELELKKMFGLDPNDDEKKEDFNLIVNVLTKILMVFGEKPFIDRSNTDPLFLYVKQLWFQTFDINQHRYNIPFLLDGWANIITQWVKLDYKQQKQYSQQIPKDNLYLDDDDD